MRLPATHYLTVARWWASETLIGLAHRIDPEERREAMRARIIEETLTDIATGKIKEKDAVVAAHAALY